MCRTGRGIVPTATPFCCRGYDQKSQSGSPASCPDCLVPFVRAALAREQREPPGLLCLGERCDPRGSPTSVLNPTGGSAPSGTPPRSPRRPDWWGHDAMHGMPYKPRFALVFLPLAIRRALFPLPPPMAPKRGKGAVRKVKQSVGKEKAAAGPARAAPLPPPR